MILVNFNVLQLWKLLFYSSIVYINCMSIFSPNQELVGIAYDACKRAIKGIYKL